MPLDMNAFADFPFDVSQIETITKSNAEQLQKLLASNAPKYGADANIASFIYTYLRVNVTDGAHKKQYSAQGGAAGVSGVGQYWGEVYTDDIDRLYRETSDCQFNCAFSYLSVVFFNNQSQILGTFQGGGLGTLSIIGGAHGNWTG